jgi:hypothetical protein
VACNHQTVVSVASLAEPTIELTATGYPQCASVRSSIIVDVIQTEKLNHTLAATRAGDIPVAVVT